MVVRRPYLPIEMHDSKHKNTKIAYITLNILVRTIFCSLIKVLNSTEVINV